MTSLKLPYTITMYGFRNSNAIVNTADDNLHFLLEIFPSEFPCNNGYNSCSSMQALFSFHFLITRN